MTAHTTFTNTSWHTRSLQTHHGKNNFYKHIAAHTRLQVNHEIWVNKLSFRSDYMLKHNFHTSLLTDT